MKLRGALAVSFGSIAFGAGLVACFDLFHSTGDVLPLCALDAQAQGCGESLPSSLEGGTDADTTSDFCAWSPAQARTNAQRACAWLGACESPMGRNAFGDCMFQALMAYDCAANPNHRSKGQAHALWDCLWRVNTCGDVSACIFPDGPQSCTSASPSTTCASASNGTSSNLAVRLECVEAGGPPSPAENCGLWGQTCASFGNVATCAGSNASAACSQDECFGYTELRWCRDGGDIGIDCANNGAQHCDGFPTAEHAMWIACRAESDAGTCQPDLSASCVNGVAHACPSAVPESINCGSLLGVDGGGCAAGPLNPSFDWSSPCAVTPAMCTNDACNGGMLLGCARGAAFTVPCSMEGLGPCRMVATDIGQAPHAACSPPR